MWYKNLSPAVRLLLTWLFWSLWWFLFIMLMRWFDNKEVWVFNKELILAAFVGGAISTLFYGWKLLKAVFSRGGRSHENFESIE